MCECYFLVLPLTNQVFDFFEAFTPAYVLKTNDWLGKTLLMAIILGWFCLFLIYVWNRIFFYHVKVLVYLPTLSLLSQNWQKKVFRISATCSSLVPGKFLSITIILIGNALLSEIKSLTVFQKVLLFIASFLLSDFVKGYFLKFSRSLFVNLLTFNKVIPCGKPTFLCNLLQQER